MKEVQLPEDIVKQIPMIIKSAATPLQVSMEDGSEPENTSEPEVEDVSIHVFITNLFLLYLYFFHKPTYK